MITDLSKLSPRELEVAKLLSQGLNYREIGQVLFLQPGSLNIYTCNIKAKLGFEGSTLRLAVELCKWKVAKEGITQIVREWLETPEAKLDAQGVDE